MISPEAGQMWFRIAFIIVSLSLILGGALGNFIDRLRMGASAKGGFRPGQA